MGGNVKTLLLLLLLLTTISCSMIPAPFEPESFKKGLYRKDMKLEANDFKALGVLVVPYSEKVKIEAKAIGKLDLFTFMSGNLFFNFEINLSSIIKLLG